MMAQRMPIAPSTLSGLEKYLGSGLIHGIGPGFAKRIVHTFGMDSLSVLDEHPERLSEVSGIGERRIQEIIGERNYNALPYYGRWVLGFSHLLVEKGVFTRGELEAKLGEVRARYAKPA